MDERTEFITGEIYQATIIEIRPQSSYDLIITRRFLDQPLTEGWYPSKDFGKFKVGDGINITPLTKVEGKGSLTTFRLENS